MENSLFFLHWIHIIAAIIWIGTLYFFNFFLMPFVEKSQPQLRIEIFHRLVPNTLWGFRWGGFVTFVTGVLIYLHRLGSTGPTVFFNWPYGLIISVGGLLGTVMFLNGWFVMHPKQKVVIASATRVAQGGQPLPEAPACSRRVVLASRTNLLLSIPTLFFMVAASHYSVIDVKTAETSLTWFWIIILVIMGVLEINALTGTQGVMKKPLDSLSASLLSGIILTVVLYLLFPALL